MDSKWITNAQSRQFTHDHLRKNVDGILTTYKTVLQDKSSLTIRDEEGEIQETNVIIIDRQLDLLQNSSQALPIFYSRQNSKIIFITEKNAPTDIPASMQCIKGVFHKNGLEWSSVSKQLLALGFYTILTEGGKSLNSSLIQQAHADELYLFIAPKILHDLHGLSSFGLDRPNSVKHCINLNLIETKIFDQDVLLHYRFIQSLD